VVGGFDGEKALSVNEAYTPSLEGSSTTPWSSAPQLPEGRFGMAAASVADTILIIGGSGLDNSPAPSYHFFPSLGSWVKEDQPDPQTLTGLSAVPLEQLVYILGGKLGEQATSQVKSYQAVYTISIPLIP
jgi:N-acetylneuraminic acid mutarotase